MQRYSLLSLAIFGVACAELKIDIDSDEDGLLDSEEALLGTDPQKDDSDDDGHLDGDEVAAGFDPNSALSYPYTGDYPTAKCDPTPQGTGYAVGDISQDWELVDQHGDLVKLSDFCGKTIILETSAFW